MIWLQQICMLYVEKYITLTIQGLDVWAIISRSSQKNAESDLLI